MLNLVDDQYDEQPLLLVVVVVAVVVIVDGVDAAVVVGKTLSSIMNDGSNSGRE